jgi:uncharacterized protein YjbI with pentapeptide repeats
MPIRIVSENTAGQLLDRYRHGERDFRGARLRGARLRWADLKGADLGEADLEGADLEGARLVGSRLNGANLKGANLKKAHAAGAHFRDTDLSGANLEQAQLLDAQLRNANLKDASLRGARLVGARLTPAEDPDELFDESIERRPQGVALRGADLTEADLLGADLLGADMRGANLRKANLFDANLWRADLRGARLMGTNLTCARLLDADLGGATLMGATLNDAFLTFAELAHANLWGVNARKAKLQRANLWAAGLEKADLEGAILEEANLAGARLWGANLRRAVLINANLRRTDLTGARLQGADLRGAVLGGTTLCNLDLSGIEKIDALESIKHTGPSYPGLETLLACGGSIPREFLVGCGLSDLELELAGLCRPGLSAAAVAEITRRIQRLNGAGTARGPAVFIVYIREDEPFALLLYEELQRRGVRCWLDEKSGALPRQPYAFLDHIIREWDRIVVCASGHSLSRSAWIADEIRMALDREEALARRGEGAICTLVVADLDGGLRDRGESGPAAEMLRGRAAVDFRTYERGDASLDQEQVERLVRTLRQ